MNSPSTHRLAGVRSLLLAFATVLSVDSYADDGPAVKARKKWETALKEITDTHSNAVTTAYGTYSVRLKRGESELKQRGDLLGYKELSAERRRFAASGTLSSEHLHAYVARCAAACEAAIANAEAEKNRQKHRLASIYSKHLDKLVKDATSNGRIGEAEELAKELTRIEFELAVTVPEKPKSTGPSSVDVGRVIEATSGLNSLNGWQVTGPASDVSIGDINGRRQMGGKGLLLDKSTRGEVSASHEISIPDWAKGLGIKVTARIAEKSGGSSGNSSTGTLEVSLEDGGGNVVAKKKHVRQAEASTRDDGVRTIGGGSLSQGRFRQYALEFSAEEVSKASKVVITGRVNHPITGTWFRMCIGGYSVTTIR